MKGFIFFLMAILLFNFACALTDAEIERLEAQWIEEDEDDIKLKQERAETRSKIIRFTTRETHQESKMRKIVEDIELRLRTQHIIMQSFPVDNKSGYLMIRDENDFEGVVEYLKTREELRSIFLDQGEEFIIGHDAPEHSERKSSKKKVKRDKDTREDL